MKKDVKALLKNGEVFNVAMIQQINAATAHDLTKQEDNVHFEKSIGPISTLTLPHFSVLTGTKLAEMLQWDPLWDEIQCAKCQILTAPLGFLFSDKLQILEQVFCHLQELMVTTGWSFFLESPFIYNRWLLSAFFPLSFWVP